MRLLLFTCVFCLLASSSLADDSAEANRLLVEATKLVQASDLWPSADGKHEILKQAHDKLVEIIERYPSTDLAVKLSTGQRIGNISLSEIRKALARTRPVEPRPPGAPVHVWRLGAGVVAVASPSGGRWALTVDRKGVAGLRDIQTGDLRHTWQHRGRLSAAMTRQRRGGTSAVALSPGAWRMLTAGQDGTVLLHDVAAGRVLRQWQHKRTAEAVALSRDKNLAMVGVGRDAFLVDSAKLKVRRSWRGKSPVTAVAYAPNGRWILAGFADGRAVLGEARTGKTLHTWKHPGSGGGGVMSAVFSPDSRRVLTGAANRMAVLRDAATGRTLHEWSVGSYRITSVAYSRDGRWVLTGDEGYEVELHDAQTGRTVRKWRYDASAEAVAFSWDGQRVLMGFADGAAILCDLRIPGGRRGYARTHLTSAGGCW